MVSDIRPPLFFKHAFEGREGLDRCIEIAHYHLRARLHVAELVEGNGYQIVRPFGFQASLDTARPTIYGCNGEGSAFNVHADDEQPSRLDCILVIIGWLGAL